MKILKGISAASGIRMGVVCLYSNEFENELPHYSIKEENIEEEIVRLKAALDHAVQEMKDMVGIAAKRMDKDAVEIFNTHLMIISDNSLFKKITNFIKEKKVNAEHAVNDIFEEYINMYRAQKGHFMELTHDFVDARNRVLAGFNIRTKGFKCEVGDKKAVIVAAKSLTPSMVLNTTRENVLAFVTEEGGFTSHGTILARSYGVPVIFGINVDKELKCGMEAIVNGSLGKVIISADKKTKEYYRKKINNMDKKSLICEMQKGGFKDERKNKNISVKLNISMPEELYVLNEIEYDGIGLLRSEFLFMQRENPPSENEQFEVYKSIFQQVKDKPVTVRLLDIGADKMPSFLKIPDNINTDLELRGAIAAEVFSEMYVSQVKAILRAGLNSKIRLLYPMVSDHGDLITFRKIVSEAKKRLEKEKIKFNKNDFQEGIMIETPAAVMMAGELIKEVDFINIGSNDLLQYTLAASRGNILSEKRYHILHPSIVKMLEIVAREGARAGKEVCLCGEIASFEEFYPVLIAAGLRSFSVAVSKFKDINCELMHLSVNKETRILKDYYLLGSKDAEDKYIAKFI